MSIRFTLLTVAVLSACAQPASAQEGTKDQQTACRGDTRRFCRAVDPDSGTFGILNCLKQNRSKLSQACRALLESHGQ